MEKILRYSQAAKHFENCCFTCAVPSDKAVNLTLFYVDVDISCGNCLTVGFR